MLLSREHLQKRLSLVSTLRCIQLTLFTLQCIVCKCSRCCGYFVCLLFITLVSCVKMVVTYHYTVSPPNSSNILVFFHWTSWRDSDRHPCWERGTKHSWNRISLRFSWKRYAYIFQWNTYSQVVSYWEVLECQYLQIHRVSPTKLSDVMCEQLFLQLCLNRACSRSFAVAVALSASVARVWRYRNLFITITITYCQFNKLYR